MPSSRKLKQSLTSFTTSDGDEGQVFDPQPKDTHLSLQEPPTPPPTETPQQFYLPMENFPNRLYTLEETTQPQSMKPQKPKILTKSTKPPKKPSTKRTYIEPEYNTRLPPPYAHTRTLPRLDWISLRTAASAPPFAPPSRPSILEHQALVQLQNELFRQRWRHACVGRRAPSSPQYVTISRANRRQAIRKMSKDLRRAFFGTPLPVPTAHCPLYEETLHRRNTHQLSGAEIVRMGSSNGRRNKPRHCLLQQSKLERFRGVSIPLDSSASDARRGTGSKRRVMRYKEGVSRKQCCYRPSKTPVADIFFGTSSMGKSVVDGTTHAADSVSVLSVPGATVLTRLLSN